MKPKNKTYTIKEIAELAGVSKGTVDRVIHKRGKVADKTAKKIKQIVNQVGFKPNIIAQNLKRNKKTKIVAFFPDPKIDVFWKPCVYGVEMAIKQFGDLQIEISNVYFNHTDPKDFVDKSLAILKDKPNGLVFPPIFQQEAKAFVTKCETNNIKYHLFNNQILGLSNHYYVGQNLFKSGRIGAKLLQTLVTENQKIALLHIDESDENALHMTEKEKGFKSFFEQQNNKNLKYSIHHLKHKKIDNLKKSVNYFLDNNPSIKGVYITNSKAHIIAQLAANKKRDLCVVGYDLTKENTNCLKTNAIDFLIHQAPQKQILSAIGSLAENFLFGKKENQANFLPIDIISSENFEEYLNRDLS